MVVFLTSMAAIFWSYYWQQSSTWQKVLGTSDTASLEERVTELEKRVKALEKKISVGTSSTTKTGATKEVVIFMGSGSTHNRDWTTITGATVDFNPAEYGTIKEVIFEAGLAIVSGEAQARLIDLTTGTIYHQSQIANNTQPAVWQSSVSFPISQAARKYGVQLRSSNNEQAILEGARLRIKYQ